MTEFVATHNTRPNERQFCLLGLGAIGQAILCHPSLKDRGGNSDSFGVSRVQHPIQTVVVRPSKVKQSRDWLDDKGLSTVRVQTEVPMDCTDLIEVAGHTAIREHVLPALRRGIDVGMVSIGALADPILWQELDALVQGLDGRFENAGKLSLLPGAIAGIDALKAASLNGLEFVQYKGRKPPLSWKGTPAEGQFDLSGITEPTVIFRGSARQAALLYPKNANVAATISFAGLGLDRTEVELIADPQIKLANHPVNIHEIHAKGEFGEMQLKLQGKPLRENPKTSTLTVLSVLRYMFNSTGRFAI